MINIFISYAISEQSQKIVSDLVKILRARKMTVVVDIDVQTPQGPEEGWPIWMKNNISKADWVLLFFDETYRRRFDGKEKPGNGLGATWEARIITNQLYTASGKNSRFIPLLGDNANKQLIPDEFQGDFYRIPSESHKLADALLRTIPMFPPKVNFTKLQRPAINTLIGRVDFKEDLFRALKDDNLSVLGIIADGGIGKTALIYDWLSRLEADKYDLSHIYAWPFYDMERHKTTTSSDFFIHAFEHFGDIPEQKFINVEDDKAYLLLDKLKSNKTILVLDGLEVLQHTLDENRGQLKLKDRALHTFLQSISTLCRDQANRLVIITSRLPILDLQGTLGYRELPLKPLTPSDGAKLLSQLSVGGCQEELEQASSEFEGHCLSLVLLGKIIANWFSDAQIRNRHQVCSIASNPVPVDPENKVYWEHAQRVMAFYEQEISEKKDIIMLQMMGLFHSPMLTHQRDHLIKHTKFASSLQYLSPREWNMLARKLEKYGLLAPENGLQQRIQWDCHPLIRENFRNMLRKDADAWHEAHQVLFDYFQKVAEPQPSSLSGLIPLYRAVHHGCLAQDYTDALSVYRHRILRHEAQGYSTNRLGAAAEDIACLQGFFDTNTNLDTKNLAWLWSRMAFCQTCRGHIDEAVHNRKKQLKFCIEHNDITNAASASENLSALHVFGGDLYQAEEAANNAINFALDTNDWGQEMRGRCRLGAVFYFKGNIVDSSQEFDKAKKLQEKYGGSIPWLPVDYGFYYRLLLLELTSEAKKYIDILHDAEGASGPDRSWLAPMGLDYVVKGICLSKLNRTFDAEKVFNEEAKEILKESGFIVYLPYYFNAKAEFDIARGDTDSAMKEVIEAGRISYEYGIPLLQADSYLIKTQIHIAKGNATLAHETQEKARLLVENHGYYHRTLDIELLRGQLALLDNHVQDGERILKQVRERIEETGRKSLLKRWNESVNKVTTLRRV